MITYSKLLSQYILKPIKIHDERNSELILRVSIYHNMTDEALLANVERLDLYEVKPFGCKDIAHVNFWVLDDFCNTLMDRISKNNEMQILDSFIQSLNENGFDMCS